MRAAACEEAFRDALRLETARGLVAIIEGCGGVDPSLETISAHDDYDAQLTLGTVEVFAAALQTRFRLPGDLVGETLGSIGAAGAALLLARSAEPEDPPYPVAQRGFDGLGVRALVGVARLASELGRFPAASGGPTEGSITTFAHDGDLWRCVAGDTRLVLLRASAQSIEPATTRALRLVAARAAGAAAGLP